MRCQKRYSIPIAVALAVITAIAIVFAYYKINLNKPDVHDPADDNRLPFENQFIRIQLELPHLTPTLRFIRNKTDVQVLELNNLGADIRIYAFGSKEDFSLFGSQGYFTFRLVKYGNGFYVYEVRQSSSSSNYDGPSCFQLRPDQWSWYGGPAQQKQFWPIEKVKFHDYEYAPKRREQINVAERYWLNSAGSFVFFRPYGSLIVNQNIVDSQLCMRANSRDNPIMSLEYVIGVGRDATQAHQYAIHNYLRETTMTPSSDIVRYPTWSTGERFGKNVNETAVLQYASEIERYGFDRGQLLIDDRWEGCYGTLDFDERKFPNAKNMSESLGVRGFLVSLWIHPFVNSECKKLHAFGVEKGFFVTDAKENVSTTWWNSEQNGAAHINFLNTTAVDWFNARLKQLYTSYGINTFKFDGGEVDLIPWRYSSRHYVTQFYINAAARYGAPSTIGVGFNSQAKSMFLRMPNLDSTWSWDNGLPNVVTKMLHLGMVGYKYVVPDVVGGHTTDGTRPDKELYIRWMQAVTFMPVVQFSYAPWDFDEQTVDICRKLLSSRKLIWSDYPKGGWVDSSPYITPIWWLNPDDRIAQRIDDEFLVGGWLLSAPVLQQGQTSRNIYLPQGVWRDGITDIPIQGPTWLMDYPAPLDVLPYFIKELV